MHHKDEYLNEFEKKSKNTTIVPHCKASVEKNQLNALIKFIVMSYQPICVVNNKYFREYIASITPKPKFFCRDTVVNAIFEKSVELKQRLRELIKDKIIAITTDCWTSCKILITIKNMFSKII